VTSTEVEFLATDRCDRCTARAMVRATFAHGELMFCGHHSREMGDKLLTTALSVYDPEGLLDYVSR